MPRKEDYFSSCTSILVGKNAMAAGTPIIGRNEDANTAWPKHMVIHAHQEAPTPQQFKSPDNGFTIDLPTTRLKYTATPEWTPKYGVFEEDGINEENVAMSATESAYANERVLAYDPLNTTTGIGEEAMVTVVLPYIHSAREGVTRLGKIVTEHGAAETNGVLFADENEVWYMEIATGHYWVAQRIPDDAYAVVANQLAIQEVDLTNPTNFMAAPGIADFVNEHHLNPNPTTFNFRNIFGTHTASDETYSTPRVWVGHQLLSPKQAETETPTSEELPFIMRPDHLLQREDLMTLLANHYQQTPYDLLGKDAENKHRFRPISLAKTQESHLLEIRPTMPKEMRGLHWLAMGVTAQSVFVPTYAGATDVHAAYKVGKHEYSPDSAYWTYKLAGVLVDAHYPVLGDKLHKVQQELTTAYRRMIATTDEQLLAVSPALRTELMTTASIKMQAMGLDKMNALISALVTEATALSPLNFKTDANL